LVLPLDGSGLIVVGRGLAGYFARPRPKMLQPLSSNGKTKDF
jgi:hypothetical protein